MSPRESTREAVRRDELAGLECRPCVPPRRASSLPLVVDDADARAEIGHVAVDRHARAELADIEDRALCRGGRYRPQGPVQVVPLRLVFAVAVEHLHAVVLAVGDIDPAVGVGGDVVRRC